jgi:hypothetical protein
VGKEPVKRDLDGIEATVRTYWNQEFHETPFPNSLFNRFIILARAMDEGMKAVALAHLLHQYTMHLQSRSKK